MARAKSEDLAKHLRDAEDTVRRQDKDLHRLRRENEENKAIIKDLQEQFTLATEANQKLNDIIKKLSESPEKGPRTSTGAWNPTKQELAMYLKDAEETVRLQYEQMQYLQEQKWQQQTQKLIYEKTQAEEDRERFEKEKLEEAYARAKLQDVIAELKAKFNEAPSKEDKECSCKKTTKLRNKIHNLTKELESRTAKFDEAVSNCTKEKQSLEASLKALQEELNKLKGSTTEVSALEDELEKQTVAGLTNQQLTQELNAVKKQNMVLQNQIKEMQEELQDFQNQLK